MSLPRIYQAIPLQPHTTIHLDERANHHLAHVLRVKQGEALILFNGEGGEYAGVIQRIHKKYIEVEIKNFIAREAESPLTICLAQGIARGDKMDTIVQKSIELGVNTIVPLMTEQCSVSHKSLQIKRLDHWQSVAIHACEQCGRNRLPIIASPVSYTEWMMTACAAQRFVLSPYHSADFNLKNLSNVHSVMLLVGPEGGLTNKEVDLAIQHQFVPFNLGPRILRTETASLAAISLIQGYFGDMSFLLS